MSLQLPNSHDKMLCSSHQLCVKPYTMSQQSDQLKVLEHCRISPPPNSVPTTSIPLTFFDIGFLLAYPAMSLLMYRSPSSPSEFTNEILPQLKNSLSLALQHFFPLCGHCVCPPSNDPYILYKDADSVPLLVTQCVENFNDFLQHEPTDAKLSRLLVPPVLPKHRDSNGATLTSLLSVQVTLFPNSGICIGIIHHHVAADGMSLIHFLKTWASILKAKCDLSKVSITSPVHDKEFIKDPLGIKNFRLKQWRSLGSPVYNDTMPPNEDRVRATFTMSRFDIDRLKQYISAKYYNGTDKDTLPKLHLSSFVVTSAFIWVCIINALDKVTPSFPKEKDELCHFCVVADCRNKYDMPTFFGNCLSGKLASVARNKFKQDQDCIVTVVKALNHCVQSLKAEETIGIDIINEFPKWREAFAKGESILTVASTPKQAAYDGTDFGWGRAERIEGVHIDVTDSVNLAQSRNEEGGIEVGVCRSRREMEVFMSVFEAGINQFRYRAML